MTVPPATSASVAPTSASASNSTKPKSNWTGVLSQEQFASLRKEFSWLIICPAVVSTWGKTADAWGRVTIPGANTSYWESKDKLSRWARQAKEERCAWWTSALQENGIEAITGKDLFDGLQSSKWAAYRKKYQRLRAVRFQRLHRQKLRDRAATQVDPDDDYKQAAARLLEIGQTDLLQ